MSAHARLSFSASDRWLRCPASVRMTEALKESESSAAAQEGTIAHGWLERSLASWLATGDETIICDNQEMGEHLQPVMDYVIERYELMPGKKKKIEIEVKVDLHYSSMRSDLWGTSDVIISSDMYIDVLDLKYGRGMFVEADTSQNRLYILAAMARHMKATKGDVPWVSVRSTIMQPRYADTEGEIIRFEDFAPDELMDWFEKEVLPKAAMTDDPNVQPVAGNKQCQWCLAKATCPAVVNRVQNLCSVFEPVAPDGPQPTGTVLVNNLPIATATPENLDVDKLIEIHDNEPFIQGYLKAVNARLRTLIEGRDPSMDGKLKLVRTRKGSKWTVDDDVLVDVLTKGKGCISKKILTRQSVLSAAQALKLKLKDAQKKRLQEYIGKTEGSLAIVPWADERTNAFPPITFEDQTKVASAQLTDFDFL